MGSVSTSRSGLLWQRSLPENNKVLPSDIIAIVNNFNFWSQLYELQNLLLPLCGVLNKLQKDIARLHEILHCFSWIIKIFINHEDKFFSNQMIERLKTRWVQWEQPLLLLSFVLHPNYRLSKFTSNVSNLSYTHFGQWLGYYYQVWFDESPRSILREYLSY